MVAMQMECQNPLLATVKQCLSDFALRPGTTLLDHLLDHS